MRYILDSEGYIESIAFGSYIECSNKSCTEYTGSIPTGYNSLCEWADNANIQAYYLVDGNLTYDSDKDQELQRKWEEESQNNPQEGGITGDTSPIGAVMQWYSDIVPANWLLLNGQAVSRTNYSELFELYGTTFGAGDGITTFNLPDMRTRTPVGKDSSDSDFATLGKIGGEKTHKLTVDEMPSHSHEYHREAYYYAELDGTENKLGDTNDLSNGVIDNSTYTGGSQPHNNLQPYIVTNFIVKAKQSAGVVANVIDNLESTSVTDALSANQGRILNEKFSNLNESPKYITTGEEFATNEYIDGKRVYRKRINVGNLPNASSIGIAHGLTSFTPIRFEGYAFRESDGALIHLPYSNSVYIIEMNVNATVITITTTSDRSAFTGYVDIYYIKRTNFKVFGYDYQAAEGMTWDNFINSSYNNSVFAYTETGNIYCKNYTTNNLVYLESDTSNPIKGDKVISNGEVYTIYPKPSPTPV